MVTVDDCIEAEEIFKEDAEVQRCLRERYGIHDITEVACDPWYYGERFGAPSRQYLARVGRHEHNPIRLSMACRTTLIRLLGVLSS